MRKYLSLRLILERKGMTILTNTKLQEIVEDSEASYQVEGKDDIIANKALLSIGRVPDMKVSVKSSLSRVNEIHEASVPGYLPHQVMAVL